MSAVFHMVMRGSAAWKVMERLDHGAIFVLIAGTFTAVHGIMYHGLARWTPRVIVWMIAVACITLKTVFFESLPEWLGLSFYLGMGWGVAMTAIPIFRRHGFRYLLPLFLGGIAYSVGAIMEFKQWLVVVPGVIHAHELWHIAVLIGALFHWRFVWDIAGDDRFVETPEEREQQRKGVRG
jgi:channel protein (hemolysin III family)